MQPAMSKKDIAILSLLVVIVAQFSIVCKEEYKPKYEEPPWRPEDSAWVQQHKTDWFPKVATAISKEDERFESIECGLRYYLNYLHEDVHKIRQTLDSLAMASKTTVRPR